MKTHDIKTFMVPTDVIFTINIPAKSLHHMVDDSSGRCFYSKDEQGLENETVEDNIRRVYEVAGINRPSKTASCAARIGLPGEKFLKIYGNVVCVLSAEAARDLYIFNGDTKNIGMKIQGREDAEKLVYIIHGDTPKPEIRKRLETMYQKGKTGDLHRLIGQYFEARLLRPLRKFDITDLYFDTLDQNLGELVKKFLEE